MPHQWVTTITLLFPTTSIGRGIIKWWLVSVRPSVRPSVCLPVCRVPRPNSRIKRPRKPKIGVMEAHHTGNPWTYLEVKRSNIKVTRPINAVTDNASYAGRREFPWCKDESESILHTACDCIWQESNPVKAGSRRRAYCAYTTIASQKASKRQKKRNASGNVMRHSIKITSLPASNRLVFCQPWFIVQ